MCFCLWERIPCLQQEQRPENFSAIHSHEGCCSLPPRSTCYWPSVHAPFTYSHNFQSTWCACLWTVRGSRNTLWNPTQTRGAHVNSTQISPDLDSNPSKTQRQNTTYCAIWRSRIKETDQKRYMSIRWPVLGSHHLPFIVYVRMPYMQI